MSCVSYVVACLSIRTFDRNRREGGLETSRLLMTHGYMLSGTGSNVYVQNLCRALAGMGHDVHLLCQEPNPLSYDFVNAHYRASARGVEKLGGQATPYAGSCHVYQPEIGDLLPVYVYDDYPGWRVKTFLGLSEWEFENYVSKNVAALRTVLDHSGNGGCYEPRCTGAGDSPSSTFWHRHCVRQHHPRQLPPVRRPPERLLYADRPSGALRGHESHRPLLPQRWHRCRILS
jgi:hypothetical protein